MDSLGRGTPLRTRVTCRKFVVRSTGTALLINSRAGFHLGILLWAKQNYKRQQGQQESQNIAIQSYLDIGSLSVCSPQNQCLQAMACKIFFYLGICATSTSHWGDSCPKPCAHEAGEPVLCLKLLGQRRALRFLSSPWPHCVSCSWAGSLLLQSPTVGASTRALLSLLWSLLAICATQCCFSLDHVCSVDGYFK